jgi:chemotaxis protein histidine kinase CheA
MTTAVHARLASLVDEVERAVLGDALEFGHLVEELAGLEEEVRFFHADEVGDALQRLSEYLRDQEAATPSGAVPDELLPIIFELRSALETGATGDGVAPEASGPFLEWDMQDDIRGVLTITEESQRTINSRVSGGQKLYLGILRVADNQLDAVEEALESELQIIRHSRTDRTSRITFLAIELAPPPVESILSRRFGGTSVLREVILREVSVGQLLVERTVADEWYSRLPEISLRLGAAQLERILLLAAAAAPPAGAGVQAALWEDLRRHLDGAMTVDFRTILGGIEESLEALALEEGKSVSVEFYGNEAHAGVEVAESIRKVLFELLANAIIHGAEGPDLRVANGKPATARIRCEIVSSPEGTSIRVSDDGRGFEKDAHHPPGRGGLRRARAIVERELGGILRITSRADGVTAHLELPALHGLYRALIVRRRGVALILPSALVEWAGAVETSRMVRDSTGARFLRYQRRLIPLAEPEYSDDEDASTAVSAGTERTGDSMRQDLSRSRSVGSTPGTEEAGTVAAAVLRISGMQAAVMIDAVERETMVPITTAGAVRIPGEGDEIGYRLLLESLPLARP